MAAQEQLRVSREESEALETLLEIAVKLKETGMLDMLRVIAEKSGELLTLLGNDPGLQRATAFADAAHRALSRLEPEKVVDAKINMEELTYCTLNAVAAAKPSEAKRVGLLGLLGVLRDPDVQVGLGLLLAIAKNLGRCVRERSQKG